MYSHYYMTYLTFVLEELLALLQPLSYEHFLIEWTYATYATKAAWDEENDDDRDGDNNDDNIVYSKLFVHKKYCH